MDRTCPPSIQTRTVTPAWEQAMAMMLASAGTISRWVLRASGLAVRKGAMANHSSNCTAALIASQGRTSDACPAAHRVQASNRPRKTRTGI